MQTERENHRYDTRRATGILALLVVLLCGGCAGNKAMPAHANAAPGGKQQVQAVIQQQDPDPADQGRLTQAVKLLKDGNPAQAIQGPLDQILAHFPAQPVQGDTRYFSAVTPMEMILYAGIDQGKHHHIVVMPGEWVTALFLKGFAYNSLEQYAAAHQTLAMAAAIAPFNAHLLNELGYTCEKQKNWPEAMQTFKSAEGAADFLDGANKIAEKTRAIRGQGYVLVAQGKLDAAEADYHRALKLDPGDVISMGELHYVEQLRKKKH